MTDKVGSSMVNIVAVYEGMTDITITLSNYLASEVIYDSVSYTAGSSFSIILRQFENYLISHNSDLTGTNIHSSQPIGVVCGNKFEDSAGELYFSLEQILPIHLWGNLFILTNDPDSENVTYKIVTTEETYVTIGRNPTFSLRQNVFYELSISSSVQVSASKPVMVGRFSKMDTGMSFSNLYPVNYANQYICTTSSPLGSCDHYWNITLIAHQDSIGVYPTNNLVPLTWMDIPNTEYMWSSPSPSTDTLSSYTLFSNTAFSADVSGGSLECGSTFATSAVAVTPVCLKVRIIWKIEDFATFSLIILF